MDTPTTDTDRPTVRAPFGLFATVLFIIAVLGGVLGGAVVYLSTDVKVTCTTTVELVETSRIETVKCGPA